MIWLVERTDPKELDRIIAGIIDATDRARDQIFAIAESTRAEYERVQAEVVEAKLEAEELIREVDVLERKEQAARKRLADVSRRFSEYSEEEIKDSYEAAREFGVKLQVARERERHLLRRRNDMEVRLRHLESTVKRAEGLVSQVGIAMEFLSGKLKDVSRQFSDLAQKRELGISVIRAQEEERRRLARDIHDGPAQLLANVVLRVDLCQRLLEVDTERISAELEQLKDLVRMSLKDVRKIIYDLRPMALDDLGLIPALRTYIKGIEEQGSVDVETVFAGDERRLDQALEVAVFRLVQEATNNAIKHAEARRLTVKIEVTNDLIRAVIRDDGKGFDADAAMGGGKYGLLNMKERVELLEGEFRLDTVAEKGTKIEVVVPLVKSKGGDWVE